MKQIGMIAFQMDSDVDTESILKAVKMTGEHFKGVRVVTSLKMDQDDFDTRVVTELMK